MMFDPDKSEPTREEKRLFRRVYELLEGHDMTTIFKMTLTIQAMCLVQHQDPQACVDMIAKILPKAIKKLKELDGE